MRALRSDKPSLHTAGRGAQRREGPHHEGLRSASALEDLLLLRTMSAPAVTFLAPPITYLHVYSCREFSVRYVADRHRLPLPPVPPSLPFPSLPVPPPLHPPPQKGSFPSSSLRAPQDVILLSSAD